MKKYFRLTQLWSKIVIVVLLFIVFVLNGCRKPDKDDNGGNDNVQPMYGVKSSIYKQL